LYEWLLFLHILAVALWLGGLVVVSVLATLVLRSRDLELVGRFTGSLRIVGPTVLGPSMLAVLAFGIWLVIRSDAWNFGQAWVIAGLSLFAAAFLIGVAFQARSAIGAQRAAERGDEDEALRQLRSWIWGMRVIALLLVVAAWDMVAKPGLSAGRQKGTQMQRPSVLPRILLHSEQTDGAFLSSSERNAHAPRREWATAVLTAETSLLSIASSAARGCGAG
jgi:uncharacterized membrane protein